MTEAANQVNAYVCQVCRQRIVTITRDAGTTPFMLACRATPGCAGLSHSSFYRVPQNLVPEYEWYTPTGREYDGLTPDMRAHVDRGGLDLRRVGTTTPSRVDAGDL